MRLLLHSEAVANANNTSIRTPANYPSPTRISVWGVLCGLSLHYWRGDFKNDIDDEMYNVMSLGDTSQHFGAFASMQYFQQLKRAQ